MIAAGCRPAAPRPVVEAGTSGPSRWRATPLLLLARGKSRRSLALRVHLPRGRYTVNVRAVDEHGLAEPGGRRGGLVQLIAR